MIPPLSLRPVLPTEDLHPPSLQRDIGHLCGGPADLLANVLFCSEARATERRCVYRHAASGSFEDLDTSVWANLLLQRCAVFSVSG